MTLVPVPLYHGFATNTALAVHFTLTASLSPTTKTGPLPIHASQFAAVSMPNAHVAAKAALP
jgi:hypothetical protein